MKRYTVIILPSAELDISEAWKWLAERDEIAANRWFNGLAEVFETLEKSPQRCPLAPESRFFNEEIRQAFHGRRQHKYRILFTVRNDKVLILHVRHGARKALGESEE